MRRRLLLATVGAVAAGVLLLGLPLALAVTNVLEDRALDGLQREAEQVQAQLNEPGVTNEERSQRLERAAEAADTRYVLADRRAGAGSLQTLLLDTGGPPDLGEVMVTALMEASQGENARVRVGGVLGVALPLRVGGIEQLLIGVQSDDALRTESLGALLSIVGLAVTALGVAGMVGLVLARRLALPLEALASAAAQLGEGDFSARAPRSGIPEHDQVAAALDITAERLGTLVERSRSFGADASHQLRTPLTALRLDLEALELAGADGELLAAAFHEADRLEATIDELLALADLPMGDEHLQLGALVEARLGAWESLAEAEGRGVALEIDPVPMVRARAAAIGQCLQVLLDNALEHGRGTITVSVSSMSAPRGATAASFMTTPVGERGWVRLCVRDEGPGFAPDTTPGRGLRLAKSLVQAEGGRIQITPPSTVCLLLPAVAMEAGRLLPPPREPGRTGR